MRPWTRAIRLAFFSLLCLLGLSGCNNPEAAMQRGNMAFRGGDVPRSIANYKQAAQSEETRGAANFNLGRAYLQQKKYSEALQALDQVKGLEVTHPLVGMYRARAYLGLGQAKLAGEELERCVTVHPGASQAWLELAKFRASKSDFSGAMEGAKQARLHPGLVEESSVLLASWLKESGDVNGAIGEMQKLVASHGFSIQHRYQLARYLMQVADYREAERQLRSALMMAPGHAEGLLMLGRSLVGQTRLAEAREMFELLIKIRPGDDPYVVAAKADLEKISVNRP